MQELTFKNNFSKYQYFDSFLSFGIQKFLYPWAIHELRFIEIWVFRCLLLPNNLKIKYKAYLSEPGIVFPPIICEALDWAPATHTLRGRGREEGENWEGWWGETEREAEEDKEIGGETTSPFNFFQLGWHDCSVYKPIIPQCCVFKQFHHKVPHIQESTELYECPLITLSHSWIN